MNDQWITRYGAWCWVILALILFVPYLGGVHLFDWDEINFAEIAREMLVTGDFLSPTINYKWFWEKPPLFIWLQAGCMAVFGVNEFAARLPNALCGALTLALLFYLGRQLHGWRMGMLWPLCYAGSILPHLYFRSGIIDPWFNGFIFLSLVTLWRAIEYRTHKMTEGKSRTWPLFALAGLWIGLAVLTKGPVALIIVGLTMGIWAIWGRFRFFPRWKEIVLYGLMALVVTAAWFGLTWLISGPWFIEQFLVYQWRLLTTPDAGHGGFLGYHFVVNLVGCFPASVLCLAMVWQTLRGKATIDGIAPERMIFARWMVILLSVVLILFSLVKSKIVHYSSLAYFPISYFAALQILALQKDMDALRTMQRVLLIALGVLMGLVMIALPIAIQYKSQFIPLIADPFAVANLSANVQWTGVEAMVGVCWLGFIGYWAIQAKHKPYQSSVALLVGTMCCIAALIYVFVPRIEPYSQGAAIRFFKTLAKKDCYVHTLSYKSYAQYFYAAPKMPTHPNYFCQDTAQHASLFEPQCYKNWLLFGNIDKDAYFVAKNIHADEYLQAKYKAAGLVKIGEENGFVFFKRSAVPTP